MPPTSPAHGAAPSPPAIVPSSRRHARRLLAPAVALVIVAGGCGDSGSGGAAAATGGGEGTGAAERTGALERTRAAERTGAVERTRAEERTGAVERTAGGGAARAPIDGPAATARAFARAVLSGRTARMCRLLRGQARQAQGCGGMGEDFGPMLRLTVRSPRDVRLVSATGREARAAFPRLGRDARKRPTASWCTPQQMRLQRRGDRWFVVELAYGGDFEPVRAGCHGLPSAARDPRQALPVLDAADGACPQRAPDPLEADAVERARGAALRQAAVLYPGTDLTGMRATRAVLAPEDDRGRGGYARVECGAAVQERTVVVELEFPAMKPSASLSQGVVLVSRFGAAHRVWAVLH